MCGIAGFFRLNERESHPGDEPRLWDQIATFRYRGPDSEGVFAGPGVGLGHVRLAILDLTADASQPMTSASGRTVVSFNGEIYNFADLRRELEARGHRFRTRSDTEVIVEGYEAWGAEVVHHLRGMFAIALWDADRDRLVLYRDRVGKKPLYYAMHDGTFLFASEIKGILRWPGVPREPDFDGIHEFLTYQYVPAPRTGFAGIRKLPPAHALVVERGRAPRLEQYFRYPPPADATPQRVEDLCEDLVHRLREATRLRMLADVPVGAFLSGGVDSSSVVALMAGLSSKPVRTFTIGFEEKEFDERPYARMVADRYGTCHEEAIVRPDAIALVQDLVYHYNEPYADSSALPTYLLSRLTRESVTVALSGEGSDESFLGYPRYMTRRDRVQGTATSLQSPAERYADSIAYFPDPVKEQLYGCRMHQFLGRSAIELLRPYLDASPSLAAGAAWADIHSYLPDDLLVKMDVASMAHSLEVRCPFVDQELMRWAAAIPVDQKAPACDAKWLLKRAMAPYLPEAVLARPKKGFVVPIQAWFDDELKQFLRDTLLGSRASARGLFDPHYVAHSIESYRDDQRRARQLWALLVLELWFEMWIDPADCFDHAVPRRIMRADWTDRDSLRSPIPERAETRRSSPGS
jgi:asparagine synthase (glutamine-hydrolysing)